MIRRVRRPSDRLPRPGRVLAWIYLGRVAIAAAVWIAAAWVWSAVPASVSLAATAMLVAAGVFAFGSFLHTHVRDRTPGRVFLYAQALFDVALVTGIVHLTGGGESAFAPLYILVIVAAAILLPMLGGILVGVLASLLYLGDILLTTGAVPDAGVVLQVVLFATVALVTGYLGDRLRQTGAELGEVATELRRLRLDTDDILKTITSGVLTVGADGRLAYLNDAGAAILGIGRREWIGQRVFRVLEERAPGLGSVIEQTLADRRNVKRYETRETGTGSVLGVSTTLMERAGGERPGVTAIFQDITERKRVEALRNRTERLESVAELSASLAHEIKNPLASIRSAVEQLAMEGIDDEDRGVLRGLILRESDRLSRILTEFIDFARVRTAEREAVEMPALVRHAIDLVRTHPDAAGRTIRLEEGPGAAEAAVRGDADLLHRAVSNLVLNAAQWAGDGGEVEVEVETLASELLSPTLGTTDAVRIRVSDTGPGVPPDKLDSVFDPFFTQRPGGTGLGLALVQRATVAHGGAVFVENRGGSWGATFTLYLPAAPADARAPRTDPRTVTS